MSNEILRIKTITQLHEFLGFEKPRHPLISVIDVNQLPSKKEVPMPRVTSDFYMISMKEGYDCGLQYGRNHYDFEEGVLIFTAPDQVFQSNSEYEPEDAKGWLLFFHPDLIRRAHLGQHMGDYTFFSYEVHEALHLSDEEKDILNDCVRKIQYEYNRGIDAHSQTLLISNLELLLNYSKRFYERQFHTRSNQSQDVVSQFEHLLHAYFKLENLAENGLPSVDYFAERVNLSPNYLSDLLKKETGKNIKSHINEQVVEKAKTMLLNSRSTVSEIAYDLGFNYPHYFSRMFKAQTGLTPQKYRTVN
jgi:AraC-like DNA-binding protein